MGTHPPLQILQVKGTHPPIQVIGACLPTLPTNTSHGDPTALQTNLTKEYLSTHDLCGLTVPSYEHYFSSPPSLPTYKILFLPIW